MKDKVEDFALQAAVLDALEGLERARDGKEQAKYEAQIDDLFNPSVTALDRVLMARQEAISAATAIPSVPHDHPDHEIRVRQRFAALAGRWPIRRVSERDKRRTPKLLADVDVPRPAPILTAKAGAVLCVGTAAVVAGEGGVSKSALALSVAADAAGTPDGKYSDAATSVFRTRGSHVLVASFEDQEGETGWRWRQYLELCSSERDRERRQRVHILSMKSRPIFGPEAHGGHYSTRPVELPGWQDLWDAVEVCEPGLVIIDTAMSSFAGDATTVPAVRDYLSVVELEAEVRGCGVLILGHSTKKVREDTDAAQKGRGGNGDARKTKKAPDPFHVGHIAGSAAWIDGGRAALSLTYGVGRRKRTLAVLKSNYGPDRIARTLVPVCVSGGDDDGAVVGLRPEEGSVWGELAGDDEGEPESRERQVAPVRMLSP